MSNTITLNITGMKCGGCSSAVEEAIKAVDGVDAVEVSLEDKTVQVSGSADKLVLAAAIETAGFKVEQ